MSVKSWIAPLGCPKDYWLKTTDIETIKDLSEIPSELIKEIVDLYPNLKTGRAKDQETKKKMIDTLDDRGRLFEVIDKCIYYYIIN